MNDHSSTVARLRELIANQVTETLDDGSQTTRWLQRLCRAAALELPASGVGVSLFTDTDDLLNAAASDTTTARVEELQFSLGEGPCLSAYASRHPVLVADLSGYGASKWPVFARAAHDQGVRAVFSFPLQVGAARLGAIDVYRDHVGMLPDRTLAHALIFAELALEGLLDAGASPAGTEALLEDMHGQRYEVYQAQGMVMIQLGVSAHEALDRLRGYAFAQGQPLNQVAGDVITRKITMERDPPPSGAEEARRDA